MLPLADPHFLPFKLDLSEQRILLVRMDAEQRREAAFLDERALKRGAEGGWIPLAMFLQSRFDSSRPADAIFHIGHCGSTLLSRVLESWPGMQALREPLPLRTLAQALPSAAEAESRSPLHETSILLRQLWNAWSRPLAAQQRTAVKATSSCNALIAPLLGMQPAMRAVLLDMPLRPYLATLSKSPDSTRDATAAAGERLSDLHARGYAHDIALHALSVQQQCAMGWLAERVRFAELAQAHADRVLRVDFERLLSQPEAELVRIATHLQLDAGAVPAALASPSWARYSKAQDYGYGSQDRAHDLALALQRNAREIEEGIAWVEAQVQRSPQLQRAI